jgi:hypothetical protein
MKIDLRQARRSTALAFDDVATADRNVRREIQPRARKRRTVILSFFPRAPRKEIDAYLKMRSFR